MAPILVGYTLSPEDFIELVKSMPRVCARLGSEVECNLGDYIKVYSILPCPLPEGKYVLPPL